MLQCSGKEQQREGEEDGKEMSAREKAAPACLCQRTEPHFPAGTQVCAQRFPACRCRCRPAALPPPLPPGPPARASAAPPLPAPAPCRCPAAQQPRGPRHHHHVCRAGRGRVQQGGAGQGTVEPVASWAGLVTRQRRNEGWLTVFRLGQSAVEELVGGRAFPTAVGERAELFASLSSVEGTKGRAGRLPWPGQEQLPPVGQCGRLAPRSFVAAAGLPAAILASLPSAA